jgi:chromosome segregation ATPase
MDKYILRCIIIFTQESNGLFITMTPDHALQAEIDALRVQHADTQALYREVCVLLFFRHGITPTANRLYQLVRKGSMSAPAQALASFWETLREKSRVRIEHPDLPDSLREAAAELTATLWREAQSAADAALDVFRDEARAQVARAQADAEASTARSVAMAATLDTQRLRIDEQAARLRQLEQALAHEQGARAALDSQLEDAATQRRELQLALEHAQDAFAAEREQQRAAAHHAQARHDADMKRALLEVDRDRTTAARLQKELTQVRQEAQVQAQQRLDEGQRLTEALTQQRQQYDEATAALQEALRSRDQLGERLDRALAAQAAASPSPRPRPSTLRTTAFIQAKSTIRRTRR